MSYSSEVLAEGSELKAYWRLEEAAASATIADIAGNSRTGTAYNSPDFHHAAKVGFGILGTGELWSDGSSPEPPRIDIPYGGWMNVTDLTIEGWFRIPSVSGPGDGSVYSITPILLRGNPWDDYGLYIYAEDTTSNYIDANLRLPFDEFGPGVGSFSGGNLSTTFDEWHHVVGVIDTTLSTVSVYLDGALKYSQDNTFWPISGFTITSSTNNLHLLAPRNSDGSDPEIPGYGDVDEIAIYDFALSAGRIAAHYAAAGGAALPDSVVGAGAVPAPTAIGLQVATPARVIGIGAVPAPTMTSTGAAQPSTAAGIGSVPAPTASGRGLSVPAKVTGTGAVPAPVIHLTATASPATVAAIGRVRHPTAEGEGTGGGGGSPEGVTDTWSIILAS